MRYFAINSMGSSLCYIWALREDGQERCINGTGEKEWDHPSHRGYTPLERFLGDIIELTEDEALLEMI